MNSDVAFDDAFLFQVFGALVSLGILRANPMTTIIRSSIV